ncbi:MAG: sugar phosphate isomerase/epimerase [Lachnospiraceae bacterium]|nr:sugar phosphate isomerase/epimerase [Lachnospiraceae bacterium]
MLNKCIITGFADEIHRDLDVQLEIIGDLGQKYIELRGADGINIADMTMEQAKMFKMKLNAKGVKISALGSPIGKVGITDDFVSHFEKFKHVVELAKVFETSYIRMFSFYMHSDKPAEVFREEVLKRMGKMVEYAKEQNVVLLHENEKGIYGENAARCKELMEAFYGDHFKCIFDFANFVQCKQDTLEAYEMLKPYIHYLHIKDAMWENGEVVPAGMGDGNVKQILEMLDAEGYEGFLSLEPHLADFAGLQMLEREEDMQDKATNKVEEKKGAFAYRLAFDSLVKLMK